MEWPSFELFILMSTISYILIFFKCIYSLSGKIIFAAENYPQLLKVQVGGNRKVVGIGLLSSFVAIASQMIIV
jgi:hypothetical protein